VVLEFKPDGGHGPRSRALYSGYNRIQVDSNPRVLFFLRNLAATWRIQKECVSVQKKEQAKTENAPKPRLGRRKKKKGMCLADRPCLEPNAAGIDIAAREIFVALPPDRDETPVRVFDTFTEDLQAMACWLKKCRVTTVAMESTGVYWIPLYDILEAHGIGPV
jgi:hypothetical protein